MPQDKLRNRIADEGQLHIKCGLLIRAHLSNSIASSKFVTAQTNKEINNRFHNINS